MGQFVSFLGTNMRLVAVAWHVFQLTDSTVAVGLIGLAEVIPLILFSLVGGAIADSVDRRRLIARAQLGSMASSFALVILALMDSPPVILIYAVVATGSAVNAVDRPARLALLPHLVPPGKYPAAMALRQVLFQTTQIAGPAVGGIVIASAGLAWVYAFDGLSFLAALVALRWVPTIPIEDQTQPTVAAVAEGIRFATRSPLILSIFVIDLVAMIFGMPRAVFPALAQNTFGMGAAGVGLLYAAPSAGALLGALSSGWVSRVARQGRAVIAAVAVWGLGITLAGLALFSLALTLLFLAIAGAADVVSAIFRGTMLQANTPDPLLGRVSALNIMVVTGGPRVGDVEAGLVAGAVGAPASVVIGGLACLAGTVVVAAKFPHLRSYGPRD